MNRCFTIYRELPNRFFLEIKFLRKYLTIHIYIYFEIYIRFREQNGNSNNEAVRFTMETVA